MISEASEDEEIIEEVAETMMMISSNNDSDSSSEEDRETSINLWLNFFFNLLEILSLIHIFP